MPANTRSIPQSAAIPVSGGRICLVTSSSRKGWVIPKGRIEPGSTVHETALQEAWEEAGLVGTLEREPVGTYSYRKNRETYQVTVLLMHVSDAAQAWPEDQLRERLWIKLEDAPNIVREPGLRNVLASLPEKQLLAH